MSISHFDMRRSSTFRACSSAPIRTGSDWIIGGFAAKPKEHDPTDAFAASVCSVNLTRNHNSVADRRLKRIASWNVLCPFMVSDWYLSASITRR